MPSKCRCGRGYCSEIDQKCGNCRTKREQKDFDAQGRLFDKLCNTIQVVNKHRKQTGEYVGRGNPLGNPFPISPEMDRFVVVDLYDKWLDKQLDDDNPAVVNELTRLYQLWQRDGKLNLQCFCAPQRCHAIHIRNALVRAKMKS